MELLYFSFWLFVSLLPQSHSFHYLPPYCPIHREGQEHIYRSVFKVPGKDKGWRGGEGEEGQGSGCKPGQAGSRPEEERDGGGGWQLVPVMGCPSLPLTSGHDEDLQEERETAGRQEDVICGHWGRHCRGRSLSTMFCGTFKNQSKKPKKKCCFNGVNL